MNGLLGNQPVSWGLLGSSSAPAPQRRPNWVAEQYGLDEGFYPFEGSGGLLGGNGPDVGTNFAPVSPYESGFRSGEKQFLTDGGQGLGALSWMLHNMWDNRGDPEKMMKGGAFSALLDGGAPKPKRDK